MWNVYLIFSHFNWFVCHLIIELEQFFIHYEYISFIRCPFCNICSPICGLLFHSHTGDFWRVKSFNFDKVKIIIIFVCVFFFKDHVSSGFSENSLLNPWSFYAMCSFKYFMVLAFVFRYMNFFSYFLMHSVKFLN